MGILSRHHSYWQLFAKQRGMGEGKIATSALKALQSTAMCTQVGPNIRPTFGTILMSKWINSIYNIIFVNACDPGDLV